MEVSNRQSREQLLESKIAFENHICLVAASNVVCQSLLDSMNPEFDFQNGRQEALLRQLLRLLYNDRIERAEAVVLQFIRLH